MAHHDDTANEGGALGSRALFPSAITYEPKINSSTLQGYRTRSLARQESGEDKGGAGIVG